MIILVLWLRFFTVLYLCRAFCPTLSQSFYFPCDVCPSFFLHSVLLLSWFFISSSIVFSVLPFIPAHSPAWQSFFPSSLPFFFFSATSVPLWWSLCHSSFSIASILLLLLLSMSYILICPYFPSLPLHSIPSIFPSSSSGWRTRSRARVTENGDSKRARGAGKGGRMREMDKACLWKLMLPR